MTTIPSDRTTERPLSQDVIYAAKYYLGGRRGLVLAGTAVVAAGLAFNWSWLVAAGVAPLLLSALPCVAMCALGLCMSRMTGASCSKQAAPQEGLETTPAPAAIQIQPEEGRKTTDA